MNEETLYGDAESGRRAADLLAGLEPYLKLVEDGLIRGFTACPLRDQDGLMLIKLQHKALESLKINIQSVITTGKLADVELTEKEKKRA